MQVETMQMPSHTARKKWLEYSKAVQKHREQRLKALEKEGEDAKTKVTELEKEDDQLRAAYHALAQGQTLLDVPKALRTAGVNDFGEPKLAIGGADWSSCFFGWEGSRDHFLFAKSRNWAWSWRSRRYTTKSVVVPQGTFPEQTRRLLTREAIVPSVPVHLRPAGDLSGYHILWEAVWKPAAPVDPILLKRVSAHLFVVLAQWDLTPLEQSVLEGRIGT